MRGEGRHRATPTGVVTAAVLAVLLAVYSVTKWAAERARNGGGPTLIELVTYRGGAHSTSDDPSQYRPIDEWDKFPLGDPVERLKQHLIAEKKWSDAKHEELEEQLREEVMAAWKEAQTYGTMTEGPWLDPGTMFDDVYLNPNRPQFGTWKFSRAGWAPAGPRPWTSSTSPRRAIGAAR